MKRFGIAVLVLLVPALAGLAAAASPAFKASLVVSTTRPKVEVPMTYTVRVTNSAGKPIAALLTMRIADPFGGLHPVEFNENTKLIRRHPFTGVFRNQIEWPLSAVGFTLKLQAVVTVKGQSRVVSRMITTRE
ncbi:MAG: hypothetical protein FJW96_17395 [Actinobacteria bacterium]|nr:hypothetical protein [Actinomycetota bacterium]